MQTQETDWQEDINSLYKKSKLYRDPIWTEIHLSKLAIDIIDTPEFQRLDRVRQIGFADYVYRGAKHTRFLHSVGVYHVTKRIMRAIWNNHVRLGLLPPANSKSEFDILTEIVGIAGLLHDISHVPYGHALEDEMKELYWKHDDLKNPRLGYLLYDEKSNLAQVFKKETRYLRIISNEEIRDLMFLILKYDYKIEPPGHGGDGLEEESFEEKLKKALEDTKKNVSKKFVKELTDVVKQLEMLMEIYRKFTSREIKKKIIFEPYMSEVIANTICADLIDYIGRDSKGTGLKYDYDPRIEEYFVIKRSEITNERHLVIPLWAEKGPKLDICSTMVDLMEVRRSLGEKVYYHKSKVAADVMLGKLLSKIERPPEANPYVTEDSILNMDDVSLLDYCRKIAKKDIVKKGEASVDEDEKRELVEELAEMVKQRKLYKVGAMLPYHLAKHMVSAVDGKMVDLWKQLHYTLREKRIGSEIEDSINRSFNDGRTHVLIFCPQRKTHAKEMRAWVEPHQGIVKPLHILIHEGSPYIPEPLRERIENLNKSYEELWKLFIFLHPQDCDNELLRNAILLKVWNKINRHCQIELDEKTILARTYPKIFRTPEGILSKWYKDNNVDPIIEREVQEYTDWEKWADKAIEVCKRYNINSEKELCDVLHGEAIKKISLERFPERFAPDDLSDLKDIGPKEIMEGIKIIEEKAAEEAMAGEEPDAILEQSYDTVFRDGISYKGPPHYSSLKRLLRKRRKKR